MANYSSSSFRNRSFSAKAGARKAYAYAERSAGERQPCSEGATALPPRAEKPVLKVEGNAELWLTLQKVTDAKSGWVKTTRATATAGGVILNTCSRKKGSAVVAEALVFIPGAKLLKTAEGVVLT